ncbi:hypothetical protein ACFWPP_01400 [Streptomyces anulatus]|uniref:hypothetical protein n=1 Tax=Streptomyces anulatus TaxID=1892 RepID=UPI0036544D60
MEQISAMLLGALAGGAGGEVGRQVWAALTALVRRPFGRGEADGDNAPVVSSGEAELTRLGQAPSDLERAQALSTALAVRAALDSDFRTGLEHWRQQAKLVRTGDGEVRNEISGGSQYGPVMQGRDFSGFSFTTPPLPPAPSPETASHGTDEQGD